MTHNEMPKDYRPEAVLDRVLEKVMPKDTIEEQRKAFDEAMCKYLGYLALKDAALMNRPNVRTFPEFHSVAEPFKALLDTAYNKGVEVGRVEAKNTVEDLTNKVDYLVGMLEVPQLPSHETRLGIIEEWKDYKPTPLLEVSL